MNTAHRVVGYCRVSTQLQAEHGVSLADQRRRIEAACVARDWQLLEMVVDDGYSGSTLDRPGMQQVLQMWQAGEMDAVVALRLDRLTRSVRDLQYLIELSDRTKVGLVSTTESYDTTTATGRLMLNIVGTINQWRREQGNEDTSRALQHKKATSCRYGQTPYGWQVAEDGEHLAADPAQQATIALMLELRDHDATYAEIARELARQDIRNTAGGLWKASNVSRLIHRVQAEQSSEAVAVGELVRSDDSTDQQGVA